MRPLILGLLALVMVLAALPAAAVDAVGPTPGQAVVALIDTGINPYHLEFRSSDPRFQQHPSTWIPGYPADTPALELTFDAGSWEEAVSADCEVWATVEPETLYWVPGTRIVGGISFVEGQIPTCTAGELSGSLVLDTQGHGTMVASRAAATTYGACPTCAIVAVQMPASVNLANPAGSEDGPINAIRWTATQSSWIDVQSNSWGPIVPFWSPTEHAGLLASHPRFVSAVEAVSQAQPAFWASGNGAAFRGGVLGHPTVLTPQATPSAIMVGGHDSGNVTTWPGFPPHLASDSCDSWAAEHDSIHVSGDSDGGGTSAATPFVAGRAAQLLADARLLLGDVETGQVVADLTLGAVMAAGDAGDITVGPLADGELTKGEMQRVLYTTATARPEAQHTDGPPCGIGGAPFNDTGVAYADLPEGSPTWTYLGYGATDDVARDRAREVIAGTTPMPERPQEDAWFAVDDALGEVTHSVYTAPL